MQFDVHSPNVFEVVLKIPVAPLFIPVPILEVTEIMDDASVPHTIVAFQGLAQSTAASQISVIDVVGAVRWESLTACLHLLEDSSSLDIRASHLETLAPGTSQPVHPVTGYVGGQRYSRDDLADSPVQVLSLPLYAPKGSVHYILK